MDNHTINPGLDQAHDRYEALAAAARATDHHDDWMWLLRLANLTDTLRRLDQPAATSRHRCDMANELVQAAIAVHATTLRLHAGRPDDNTSHTGIAIDELAALHQQIAHLLLEQQQAHADDRTPCWTAATDIDNAARCLLLLADRIDPERTRP